MPEPAAGERLTSVLFYGAVLLLAYLVFLIFEPFLVPLGWASVLVVFFYPLHERLERRWGRTRAAAVSTAGVTLVLVVPALLLMTLFVREGVAAARSLQRATAEGQYAWAHRAWEWIVRRAPTAGPSDLATLVEQSAQRLAAFLASQLGTILRNTAVFLFKLFVMLFALFYLFRDAGAIVAGIRQILPFEQQHRDRMITEARNLIFASVTTSLIIAGVQGLLGGTAFALAGIGGPVFWGVIMAFLALLPVVGTWPIWLPTAIWLLATGHALRGIVVVAICAGVGTLVDNFLRPLLIGGRARLSGLLVFISVLGGIAVFGMLGVVLGPIVVATAAGILDVYTRAEKTA